MSIIDLNAIDSERIEQVAALLMDGFSDTGSDAWQTLAEAVPSVRESLQKGRISRVALENSGRTAGWIGGRATYRGRVWELHPLVVRRDSGRHELFDRRTFAGAARRRALRPELVLR